MLRSMAGVERHRPVPKGLKHVRQFNIRKQLGRKTSPCPKGIETSCGLDLRIVKPVERHRPVPKGLKQ